MGRISNQFTIFSLNWLLEVKEGDENWHEVGDGHGRQNDIVGFWIARAQCMRLRAKRTQRALQAVLPS